MILSWWCKAPVSHTTPPVSHTTPMDTVRSGSFAPRGCRVAQGPRLWIALILCLI